MFEVLRHDGPGRITRVKVGSKVFSTPNLVFNFTVGSFNPPPQLEVVAIHEREALPNVEGKIKIVPIPSPLIFGAEESLNYGLSLKADILLVSTPMITHLRDLTVALLDELIESMKTVRKIASSLPIAAPLYYLQDKSLRSMLLSEMSKLEFPIYVLKGLEDILRNPRVLVSFLNEINYTIGPNALLYAPGKIPPSYYLHLVYLGVDLFDVSAIIDSTIKNLYFFGGEWYPLSSIGDLPCLCEACLHLKDSLLSSEERRQLLFNHNILSALNLLRKASFLIKQSRLREGVEEACHYLPELAAILRISDKTAYSMLEKYTPVSGKGKVYCIGPESYNRPSISRFRSRVAARYTPPKNVTLVLLLPCSARKPYSRSPSHRLFRKIITESGVKGVCEGIVTSPLGLVPRELEEVYPAAHYDVPVTGDWDQEEIRITAECIANYLNKFPDDCPVVAHLDGGYLQACKKAGELAGRDIIYTEVEGDLTSSSSLSSLKKILSRFSQNQGEIDYLKEVFKKTADYQFGLGAGEMLLSESAMVKTGQEKLLYEKGILLASISPSTGFIVPTLEGGKRLAHFSHWVIFKGEYVKGSSVMVPGVEDADPQIRPGDIVFVVSSSKELIGIGEAVLNGEEMLKLSRGVAVKLKFTKKRDSNER